MYELWLEAMVHTHTHTHPNPYINSTITHNHVNSKGIQKKRRTKWTWIVSAIILIHRIVKNGKWERERKRKKKWSTQNRTEQMTDFLWCCFFCVVLFTWCVVCLLFIMFCFVLFNCNWEWRDNQMATTTEEEKSLRQTLNANETRKNERRSKRWQYGDNTLANVRLKKVQKQKKNRRDKTR